MNINGLEVNTFIKMVSKIIGKNILITKKISGKIDFIQNKKIYKKDILDILIYVLEDKGWTIVENGNILRIVKLNNASKYNLPVTKSTQSDLFTMITEIFTIPNENVDYIASKIRHLISSNAKLVTDKGSNSLIITDFKSNIQTIKKVIDTITKDSSKYIQTVKLQHIKIASVISDLKNIAKSVFNEKIEKEKTYILGVKESNSILLIGKKKNVEFLQNYLKSIDKADSMVKKIVEVLYLKNAKVDSINKIIEGIIKQKQYKDKNYKPFSSIDTESNSMILIGPKEEILPLKELISKLDIERQQVYVKAKIIEISERRTKDVGVKYGLMGGKTSSAGLLTLSANMGGSAVAVDNINTMGLSMPSITKGLALGATINLLHQNGAADIVSEPSILCINNKESSIYVGETRSIKTGSTTTSGGTTQDTYKREDIGLTLKVTPRISNGNKVLLELQTILEDVAQSTTNSQPDTSKKQIVTTAIVNNGENIILGGYIKNKKEKTTDKIPFWGDIPILGGLFRSNREINDKINLVIIVTPYIVPKSKDLTFVREQLAKLKILEEKYTQDEIVRLKQLQLKLKENKLQTKKTIKELDSKLDEDSNSTKAEDTNETVETTESRNARLHKEILKEYFDIY
jgi:general secretion pathway protein D